MCLLLDHLVLPIVATHGLHAVSGCSGPDDAHNLVPVNFGLAVLV